jgi:hypothetical protein
MCRGSGVGVGVDEGRVNDATRVVNYRMRRTESVERRYSFCSSMRMVY